MRPLRLDITAFGPFPATETIDFTRLGENPLFLINGPTGSGKTTILDAICFALYGRTTGDEREGAQMRCDLAPGDTLSEVSFSFQLGNRSFRIRRVPEQERPKARGEGTTKQAPEAQLHELLNDGTERLMVAAKVSEATREIEELTGLSVDQFRQVMVLPQGKFRQLLMADSNEREKIFSQLFQTRIYKQLEERLKQQAADIRRKREEQLNRQQGILDGAEVQSPEALETELTELAPAVEAAAKEKEEKEAAFTAAERGLLQGQTLAQDFARLEKSEGDLARCMEERPAIEAISEQIKSAEQAARLTPLFSDRTRCEQELTGAKQEAAEALLRYERAKQEADEATQQRDAIPQLKAGLKQAEEEVSRLKGFGDRMAGLAAARTNLHKAEEAATRIDLVLRVKQLSDKQMQLARLDQLLKEKERQQTLLETQKEQGVQLRNRCEELESDSKRLELAWHQGQAAILAGELNEGAPCPVCGSLEHPLPATSDVPLPTQQQIELARKAVRDTNDKLTSAREKFAEAQSLFREVQQQIESAQKELGPEASDRNAVEREISELLLVAANLQIQLPTPKQLQDLNTEQLRHESEEHQKKVAVARSQVESSEKELPETYREPGTLDAAIEKASTTIGTLESSIARIEERFRNGGSALAAEQSAATAASAQVQKAEVALAAAQKQTADAIAVSCFADEATYTASLLDDRSLQQLKQQVTQHDERLAQLTGASNQLRDQLKDETRPDLDALTTIMQEAKGVKEVTNDAWQTLDNRLRTLKRTRDQLTKAAEERQKLDAQYAVIGTLSDVANGQTGNRISLQRFVLSVLLDDVLIEASRRLSIMSKGRYQLLRKEDRTKGNRASGLELEVEDAYTGKVRPVATLSGGESFMAALALALGLSDVVQAYAGGIKLDTLFIDEGFGSLDAESLELAIRTLTDLQATGRMIGIISHVAELKEQLALRVDVTSDRGGSSIRLVAE